MSSWIISKLDPRTPFPGDLGKVICIMWPQGGHMHKMTPTGTIADELLVCIIGMVLMDSVMIYSMIKLNSMINSCPPSVTYIRQWTGSSLVQVMACCLFTAKPLPVLMLVYCQLESWEQILVKFESEFYHFAFKKMHLKFSSAKMTAILSRGRWVK